MRAGKRDNRIEFQRSTSTPDDYGEPVETWSPIGSAWAAVYYGRGDERREAAREEGRQTASFVVLACDLTRGVTIRDRIVMAGDNWDILGTSPVVGRADIEFTALRAL